MTYSILMNLILIKQQQKNYLTEIKVHKAHSFDTEAPILDEDLSASMAKR